METTQTLFSINNMSSNNWLFAKDDDNCDADCDHLAVAHNSFLICNGFRVRLRNDGGGSNNVVLTKENEIQEEWYNISLLFAGHGTKLYINGELQDETSKTKGIADNQLPIILGKRYDKNDNTGLEGDIKNLTLHKSTEIVVTRLLNK